MTRRALFQAPAPAEENVAAGAARAIRQNMLLHWFPAKITNRSMSYGYSAQLGTIAISLFVILGLSGTVLMFLYVPSVERAYHSMKDLEFVVSFGQIWRRAHRWAAHLMVLISVLHLMRVFFTAAYRSPKNEANSHRPHNWIIGILLFAVVLFLSYTGYLLPWDQLAYWAITIGANIVGSVPVVGKGLQRLMQGGTTAGQNTLIIWYVMHVFFLPLLAATLISWHMWRIRKDGGLACVENAVDSATPKDDVASSVPILPLRILTVFLITLGLTLLLATLIPAPLEESASPDWTPNPAKAPWYFLWLQELVATATVRVGGFVVNGGLVGGVLVPGAALVLALLWPFLDKSPDTTIGVWFHKQRVRQNAIFLLIIIVIAILIAIGAFSRGPNWTFFWPWEAWPVRPVLF